MLERGCKCFPVDKLIDAKMDLLDNNFFEPLLRICASGLVGYGAAAPNCGEYSRLKLQPGGPPALRTPQFLDGLPNLCPSDLEKVQSSHTLMARSVLCLELIFAAGGHGHLEQPTNSMAWLEPLVRRFIKFCALFLVNFPACAYNRNWYKSWLLACTYPAMKSLGTVCGHPPGTHEQIAGARNPDGSYKSRATAEYPSEMCSAMLLLFGTKIVTLFGQRKNVFVKQKHSGQNVKCAVHEKQQFVETRLFCFLLRISLV